MKIAHIAISCFYIEGWGYQENLLPKYHKLAGHDVYMISSRFDKDEFNKPRLRPTGRYINNDGVNVIILDYAKPSFIQKALRQHPILGLYQELESISPDIIFVHGGAHIASLDVVKYKKKHSAVRVFADQHADYYNTPIDTFKRKIVNKYLQGYFARSLSRYTEKYWGVTPWRVEYLKDVYGIPASKVDLLVMGADDQYVDYKHKSNISREIRQEFGINDSDFLVVTGGKIDKTKNIHTLIHILSEIKVAIKISVIVFGSIGDDVKDEFELVFKGNSNFHYAGWLNNSSILELMLAADLVIFPGTHSVLWEACVACGTPMIVHDWVGMHHVDTGGNCKIIDCNSPDLLKQTIQSVISNPIEYSAMFKAAQSEHRKDFLYSFIAKKSICDD